MPCPFPLSWLRFLLLRHDAAVLDLSRVLLCVSGPVHLVVLVQNFRPAAVRLPLCPAGNLYCWAPDWALSVPVSVLPGSGPTQ